MKLDSVDILIVGGGPTGLFLGALLVQSGISCLVVEQRKKRSGHSRSIGIHPRSLEMLAKIGVSEELIAQGIQVEKGTAFVESEPVGTLSFSSCPPPFRFVLSTPQTETEAILEKRLVKLDSMSLQMGSEVTSLLDIGDRVQVELTSDGSVSKVTASYVVGCDGKRSIVRQLAGIPWEGQLYPDTYVMGDFADSTQFGSSAGIFLGDEGVVESFPLPGMLRRWVVKTDHLDVDPSAKDLTQLVQQRTGFPVDEKTCSMISPFSVSSHLASTLAKGRILLAGDAAHVVSPIGGQGMNLGWQDAEDLHALFLEIKKGRAHEAKLFETYSKARRRAAKAARRRAEFNMWIGRGRSSAWIQRALVRIILSKPLQPFFARQFTMRGLW